MARKRNDPVPGADDRRGNDVDTTVLERVQELTWALLDEEIKDDEFSLLDTLLLSDDHARNRYIECIQLHVDLMAHYAAPAEKAASVAAEETPVLRFLNVGAAPLSVQPSPPEDATL